MKRKVKLSLARAAGRPAHWLNALASWILLTPHARRQWLKSQTRKR